MFVLKDKYDKLKDELEDCKAWHEVDNDVIRTLTVEPIKLRSKVTELEATVYRLEAEKLDLMKSIRTQMKADIMLELFNSVNSDGNLAIDWVKFKEGYVRAEK